MKHYLKLMDIKAEYSMITEISHCKRTDYLKLNMTAAEKRNMSTSHIHFPSVLSKQRALLFAVSGRDLVFESIHWKKKISIFLNMICLFMWAVTCCVRVCKGNSPCHGNTLSSWRLRSLNRKQKVTYDRKTFCKGSWLTGGNYWLSERPEEALSAREVLPSGILNKELSFLLCDMVTLLF